MNTLSDTTIFNDVLKALDTGKIIYLYNENSGNYNMVSYVEVFMGGITITSNGVQYTIYPSEGYNTSDLYTPTNFVISETSEGTVAR